MRKKFIRSLLAAVLLTLSQKGLAQLQNIRISEIPTIGQLPVNAISHIFQDSEGYMWYGTVDGLCRDDGYNVHVFRNDYRTPNLMDINLVWDITEDNQRHIWFATQKGVYILDKTGYTIRPVDVDEIRNVPVYLLRGTSDGYIWIVVGQTLYKMSADGSLLKKIPLKNGVNCMYEDSKHRLYLALAGGGLYRKEPGNDDIKLIEENIDASCITEDNSHQCLWITTYTSGVIRYDLSDGRIDRQPVTEILAKSKGLTYYTILQDDRYGHLWVRSSKDLHVFRINSQNQMETVSTEGVLVSGNKTLDPIIKTRDGSIWVPAFDRTSFKIDFQQNAVKVLPIEPMKSRTGFDPAIVTLCRDDDGYYWYYQERCGLFFINPETMQIVSFRDCPSVRDLPLGTIPYLVRSRQRNSIWAMTPATIVMQLQRTGNDMHAIRQIDLAGITQKSGVLECIFEDRDGNLWMGTMNGIYLFDIKKGQTRAISETIGDISDFTQTSDCSIWCTVRNKGLCRIDASGKQELFPHKMDFLTLDATSDGRIWTGTGEGRVLAFDSANPSQYEDFTERCGMNGDMVDHIKVDKFNHLWIVTNQRIREFNPRNGAFRLFTTTDEDIPLRRFLPRAVYHDPVDGNMYFGGIPGVLSFSPSQALETMARNIKVHISDVKVMGHSVWFSENRNKTENSIEIMPDEQNMTIEFSTLEYQHRDKTRYAYRLQGTDPDWVYLPVGANSAIYNKVSKGKHLFEVKATDENGQWSSEVTQFTIVRLPAWYETVWAYLAYLLIVAGIVYVVLRQYLQIMKEREERQLVENLLKAKQLQIQTEQEEKQTETDMPVAVAEEEEPAAPEQPIKVQVSKSESFDTKFINKAVSIVEKNLSNPKLDVVFLASELGMSRSTFMRKIKAVTGQTPHDFIKSVKLKHAYQMLQDKTATIQYVMEAIGYSDHKTFTQSFKDLFGKTPSEHQKSSKTESEV